MYSQWLIELDLFHNLSKPCSIFFHALAIRLCFARRYFVLKNLFLLRRNSVIRIQPSAECTFIVCSIMNKEMMLSHAQTQSFISCIHVALCRWCCCCVIHIEIYLKTISNRQNYLTNVLMRFILFIFFHLVSLQLYEFSFMNERGIFCVHQWTFLICNILYSRKSLLVGHPKIFHVWKSEHLVCSDIFRLSSKQPSE